MDTAVWIVIPKCKLITSIITVGFIVLGKWTWTLEWKLGLMQMLTDWWSNGWRDKQTDRCMENQIPILDHDKSRRNKKATHKQYTNLFVKCNQRAECQAYATDYFFNILQIWWLDIVCTFLTKMYNWWTHRQPMWNYHMAEYNNPNQVTQSYNKKPLNLRNLKQVTYISEQSCMFSVMYSRWLWYGRLAKAPSERDTVSLESLDAWK